MMNKFILILCLTFFSITSNLVAKEYPVYPMDRSIKVRLGISSYSDRIVTPEGHGWSISIHSDDEMTSKIFWNWHRVVISDNYDPDNNYYYWVKKEDWLAWTAESSLNLKEEIEQSALESPIDCEEDTPEEIGEVKTEPLPKDAVLTSLRPVARPNIDPRQNSFWLGGEESPYDLTRELGFQLRSEHKRNICTQKLWAYSEELLDRTSMKDTTIPERASIIYNSSKKVFTEVMEAVANHPDSNKNPTSPYRNHINPFYIDPLISPELMTCIAYEESRGGARLNPLVYNNTMCAKACPKNSEGNPTRCRSTAYGWGGITLSTTRSMIDHPDKVNLMPWVRSSSIPLRVMDDPEEVHKSMMYNPEFQLEGMIYILNEAMKFQRKRKPNASDSKIFKRGVNHYDQDGAKGEYLSAVTQCMKCLNAKESPNSCYENQIVKNEKYE